MSPSSAIKGLEAELMPAVVALLAFLGLLCLLYMRLLPKPLPGIPHDQVSARKLLGDAPEMLREVGATGEIHVWILKKVNQLQEPLCQLFVQPFSRPWVVLADPVEAQNVMTRRPEFDRSDFDKTGLSPLDGFHSRHEMGDAWKRSRAWIQDLLSPSFLSNTASPTWYKSALLLLEYWDMKARLANERPFDVNFDLDHFAIDGMLALVFDEQFEHAALKPQIQDLAQLSPSRIKIGSYGEAIFPHVPLNAFVEAMYTTVNAVNYVTAFPWPRLGKWWVRQIPKFRKAIVVRRRVIEQQVKAAIERFNATGETKSVIEYMLMREKKIAEKQGQTPDYNSEVLRDEIGGQFLAGYHTSSSTLSWIFIHLTRSPDVQAKLRNTIYTTYKIAYEEGRAPSYNELSKSRVPYLDAVIEEVLRLHATLLSRTATRDTQLFGHHIPKGTTVWMLCNGPGFQSPSFGAAIAKRGPAAETSFSKDWDEKTRDMFTFEPERWLRRKERTVYSSLSKSTTATETTTTDGDDNALEFNTNAAPQFAFGQGLRGCWGRRIAYVELRIVLTLLIWQFDLLPVLPALNNTSATLSVISRADACYVRLRRRTEVGGSQDKRK